MTMRADILILGSGFGGSLLSLILARRGLTVVLIDKASHPRFAIGESSTPLANSALAQLARDYDLPELLPLTKYGSWKKAYPNVMRGLKRGFSYFGHTSNEEFDAANQMLVAASSSDEYSDTHWLRSDVDLLLFQFAERRGVQPIESVEYQLSFANGQWQAEGTSGQQAFSVAAPFVVDGTGASGELLKFHRIPDQTSVLRTHSRAVFAHFRDVDRVESVLGEMGIDQREHPFRCDDAAVHHVAEGGWMWQLRFDDDTLSAGFVFDQRPSVQGDTILSGDAAAVWQQTLQKSAFLARQFRRGSVIRPTTGLRLSRRLQRLTTQAAGDCWAVLPNTAGFIDPLHSTGIAHTLYGVRRLADIFLYHSSHDRSFALRNYSHQVLDEIRLIDELIEGCYAALPDFALWCDWCMLYFAAVTSMEQSTDDGQDVGFLRANDSGFRQVVKQARQRIPRARSDGAGQGTVRGCDEFAEWLRVNLAPWNHVGLLKPDGSRMYSSTVAYGES